MRAGGDRASNDRLSSQRDSVVGDNQSPKTWATAVRCPHADLFRAGDTIVPKKHNRKLARLGQLEFLRLNLWIPKCVRSDLDCIRRLRTTIISNLHQLARAARISEECPSRTHRNEDKMCVVHAALDSKHIARIGPLSGVSRPVDIKREESPI